MNETLKNNYYALLIAITKGKTAKESLLAMGIAQIAKIIQQEEQKERRKNR